MKRKRLGSGLSPAIAMEKETDMTHYVHEVCDGILKDYLGRPWGWIRESDFAPEVARRLSTALGNDNVVEANLELGPRLVPKGGTTCTVSRVRTEVRFSLPQPPAGRPIKPKKTGKAQQLVDLAVYRCSEEKPVIRVNGNGARDAFLHGRPEEFESLIEVKLTPGRWITSNGECPWFNDVEKLERFTDVPTRVVLFADTALPLRSVGVTYNTKRVRKGLYSPPSEYPELPWPLRTAAFAVNARGRRWTFKPCTPESKPGLFLWALGLDGRARWDLKEETVRLLEHEEVTPTCWKVTVK